MDGTLIVTVFSTEAVRNYISEIESQLEKTFSSDQLDELAVPAYSRCNVWARYVFCKRLAVVGDYFKKINPESIFDCGCGLGFMALYAKKHKIPYYGFDILGEQLKKVVPVYSQPGVRMLDNDWGNFLLRDKVDVVLALDVLEHMSDIPAIFNKFKNVLSDNGKLILSVPTEGFLYKLGRRICGFSGRYHRWSSFEIEGMVKAFFELEEAVTIPKCLDLFHISCYSHSCAKKAVASKPKISVVIPIYNEETTVGELLDKLLKMKNDYEIVIVNDGSSDSSLDICKARAERNVNIKVISCDDNKGKGHAIIKAIPHLTGELAIIQDADLELEPFEYPRLFEQFKDDDVMAVYGSRFLGGSYIYPNVPLLNTLYNFLTARLVGFLWNVTITDVTTAYKAFRVPFLKSLQLEADGFEICTEITCKVLNKGHVIKEVPIAYRARTKAQGKKVKWIDGIKQWISIFKLYRKKNVGIRSGSSILLFPLQILLPERWLEKIGVPTLTKTRYSSCFPYCRGEILEVGSGKGYLKDCFPDAVLTDRHKFSDAVVICRGEELPFGSNQFDTVLFVACLNHISKRQDALVEAHRVLKRNSRVVVTMISPIIGWISHNLTFWLHWDRKVLGKENGEKDGLTPREVINLLESAQFGNVQRKRFYWRLNSVYIAEKIV